MNKNKILLLTLVHPDLLPPVYAVAQVLRDLKFDVHILTFDSLVQSTFDLGDSIVLENIGKHHGTSAFERFKLRNAFKSRAKQLAGDSITIISFCPFSFQCGLKIKKNTPLIYISLEISDFIWPLFLKSPLSNFRNLRALQNVKKANLVATPSVQRSSWLAGRCHLDFMPYTVLNTAYVPDKDEENVYGLFTEMVPADFLDKKIVLYTGAVNSDMCTLELVRAFELVDDEESRLIIAGLRDNEYCNNIRNFVENCKSGKRIKLFPYLSRNQIFLLQSNAHIGVSLIKESQDNVKSTMMAPNKVGEYMSKDLYILGISTEYLKPFQMMGFASLATSSAPGDICIAIKEALLAVNDKDYKVKIRNFVKNNFSMQQQLKPVISYINGVAGINT